MQHNKPPTAKEIDLLKKEFNLKQRQLASCANVTLRAMQYYLSGERTMPTLTFEYMRKNIYSRQILLSRKQIKEI